MHENTEMRDLVKVRRGIFETNSSSTHSICIVDGDLDLTLTPEADGSILLGTGEFGWEVRDYFDARTKAEYLHTYCRRGQGKDSLPNEQLRRLAGVIENHTGCPVRFQVMQDEYYPWGYIDHQSIDVPPEAFESDEKLKQFIFCSNSLLHTDNDNY